MQELLSLGRGWLEAARDTMFVNEEHNATCETACLDCLLTFDAQESMQRGLLRRRLTLQILDAVLKGEPLPVVDMSSIGTYTSLITLQAQEVSSTPATSLTTEERKRRAAERQQKKR